MEQTSSKRLIWIDYMKVIGMYLIVAGHFFSIGNKYIYTFSVALFFCISGFLCKKEEDHRFFLEKTMVQSNHTYDSNLYYIICLENPKRNKT